MKLSNSSAVPVYTISGSATARQLPEWLIRRRKRSLKQDPEFASRVELLQDFEFEEASSCVRVSEDGDWVVSTGTYKPQIHVHYLPQLSLSFARHTNNLNQTFLLLSSDYSKTLHLQTDRSLEFHSPSGCHYTTRIPRYGRDLKYDRRSTEALVPSVGVNENGFGEVFRLNLEVGRFMKGYEIDVGGDDMVTPGGGALQGGINSGSVNAAAIAEESHNLLAFGTSLGSVEFWDARSRARVGVLPPPSSPHAADAHSAITALEFSGSGLSIACGSSDGLIHLYDLRSSTPILKKDQGYGYPIQDIIFLQPSSTTSTNTHLSSDPKIMSSDKRIIKIWDARDGSPWTSVEPAVDLNSVAWCKDSGMLLTANEGRQQHSFFIPQLGPAPKWCSFLDNLVEEMAEDTADPNSFGGHKPGEIYDNYKFLTIAQLRQLNLDHLVGTTSLLRPYMHGYFVNQQLYEEARLISNPDLWQEQRQKSIREKIEKERESRIRGSKKAAVKVNRRLAERIIEKEEKNQRRKAKRAIQRGATTEDDERPIRDRDDSDDDNDNEVESTAKERSTLLNDPRFSALFSDEAFAVDEASREFQMRNPSTTVAPSSEKRLTAVEEEALDIDHKSHSDVSSGDSSDEEQARMPARKDKAVEPTSNKISSSSYRKSGHVSKKDSSRSQLPQMRSYSSNPAKAALSLSKDRSFGSRVAKIPAREQKKLTSRGVTGDKELTFVPQRRHNRKEAFNESRSESSGPRGGSSNNKARRSASGNTFRSM